MKSATLLTLGALALTSPSCNNPDKNTPTQDQELLDQLGSTSLTDSEATIVCEDETSLETQLCDDTPQCNTLRDLVRHDCLESIKGKSTTQLSPRRVEMICRQRATQVLASRKSTRTPSGLIRHCRSKLLGQ